MDTTFDLVKMYTVGDTPIMRAIKQVTELLTGVEFADTATEANLVIAESLKDVHADFKKEKHYVIITIEKIKTDVPENVFVFTAPFKLPDFITYLDIVSEKLACTEEEHKEKISEVPLLPNAKRILVIDDSIKNVASAKKLLAGHYLTVVDGYEVAMGMFGKEKFDIVLSDLYLPMSPETLSEQAFKLGELVPYGFLLMCEAARSGATHVAIVTDLNHHSDHFSAAFDHFTQVVLRIENAKVMMMHARLNEDGSKDWMFALKRLTED